MVLIFNMARDYKYICHYCELITPTKKLSVCGKCKQIRYCSTDCQRNDWYQGGHKAICNRSKRDNEIIDHIKTLMTRVDDLTQSNNDLIRRVCELENSTPNKLPIEEEEDKDYIQEAYRETGSEYAEFEENSGYENGSCYGCELMMNGVIPDIPSHHSCIQTAN